MIYSSVVDLKMPRIQCMHMYILIFVIFVIFVMCQKCPGTTTLYTYMTGSDYCFLVSCSVKIDKNVNIISQAKNIYILKDFDSLHYFHFFGFA